MAFVATQAQALDFQVANQITLEWAAVPPNVEGEQIQYVVYRATHINAETFDKTNPVKLWQGPEVEYLATMDTEGKFIFGLETLRLVNTGTYFEVVSKTAIGWSDDVAIAPVPFGIQFYEPPGVAGGFGIKQ
jgi:hypothetical protein